MRAKIRDRTAPPPRFPPDGRRRRERSAVRPGNPEPRIPETFSDPILARLTRPPRLVTLTDPRRSIRHDPKVRHAVPPPPFPQKWVDAVRRGGPVWLAALLTAGLVLGAASDFSHARQNDDYYGEEDYDDDYGGDDYGEDDYGDEDDDGGDDGDPPVLTVTTDEEDDEVLIGNRIRLTATMTGAEGEDYLNGATWSWRCPEVEPAAWHALGGEQYVPNGAATYDSCEALVGTKIYRCVGRTDLHRELVATKTVKILGPNKFVPQLTEPDDSQYPNEISQLIIFRFYRDGEEIGKECPIEGIFRERIWEDKKPYLEDWQYKAWWNGEWRPQRRATDTFYFNKDAGSDDIPLNVGVDKNWRTFSPEGINLFNRKPVGKILLPSHVQKVRLWLPTTCWEYTSITSKNGWRINDVKKSDTTIEFERTKMPVPPHTGDPMDPLDR